MAGPANHHLAGVRALLVEDEPVSANVVQRFLAAAGAEVTRAATAEAARSALDATAAWDLILLDQKLPDGDGLDLLDCIDRIPRRPALVATSGFLQDSKRSLRLQTSAATLLPKPFDLDDLFRAVEDALRRAHAGRDGHRYGRGASTSGEHATVLGYGPIRVELVTQTVTVDDEMVDLQPAQFRILAQMLTNCGRPLTIRELVDGSLRGTHGDGSANVRFQIHSLRRRLGSAGALVQRTPGGYGVGIGRG